MSMSKTVFAIAILLSLSGVAAAQRSFSSVPPIVEDPWLGELFAVCRATHSRESFRDDGRASHAYDVSLMCPRNTRVADIDSAERALERLGYTFRSRGSSWREARTDQYVARLEKRGAGYGMSITFPVPSQLDLNARARSLGVGEDALALAREAHGVLYETFLDHGERGEVHGVGIRVENEAAMHEVLLGHGFTTFDGTTWRRTDGSLATRAYPHRFLVELKRR